MYIYIYVYKTVKTRKKMLHCVDPIINILLSIIVTGNWIKDG